LALHRMPDNHQVTGFLFTSCPPQNGDYLLASSTNTPRPEFRQISSVADLAFFKTVSSRSISLMHRLGPHCLLSQLSLVVMHCSTILSCSRRRHWAARQNPPGPPYDPPIGGLERCASSYPRGLARLLPAFRMNGSSDSWVPELL
jgi:hypothetical protein